MKQVAEHYADKELDESQRKVVDVFTGRADNEDIEVEREDGNRRVVMRQGNENKAGAKHSLFRHFDTQSNNIYVDDIARIPDIIAKGKRTSNGNKIAYDYVAEDGARLRVTIILNEGREEFTNLI